MSPETLAFFDRILGMVTINAKDPDFDTVTAQISTARRELAAELRAVVQVAIDAANASTNGHGTTVPLLED